jgi:hypothetical protein
MDPEEAVVFLGVFIQPFYGMLDKLTRIPPAETKEPSDPRKTERQFHGREIELSSKRNPVVEFLAEQVVDKVDPREGGCLPPAIL